VALARAAGGEKESQNVTAISESIAESAALGRLAALGDAVLHDPDIAAGKAAAGRSDTLDGDVVRKGRGR
jgi:hypothetical protein